MSRAHEDDILPISHRGKINAFSAKPASQTGVASWILYIITPSIFTKSPPRKLKPTSYLNGIRGIAAVLVYIQHHQVIARLSYSENSSSIFSNAFGFNGQHYFACLPFIRIFFSGGHFAVATFFVISGYVLSAKALDLIHKKDFGKLGDLLASALFRRWIRLYLPVAVTTVGYLTSWHIFRYWMPYKRADLWNIELLVWSWRFRNFSLLWSHETGESNAFPYNVHLWSVPVEYRGSIVIYTTLLALSRLRKNMRLLSAMALVFYFLYFLDIAGEFYAMFISGLLIRELELLSAEGALPSLIMKGGTYIRRDIFFGGLFVVGLYLGGVPAFNSDLDVLKASPGWSYLSLLSPHSVDCKWFYLFFAASFLILSIPHLPAIRKLFESRLCQYLGNISYAFYLTHGPILWTIGDRLYLAAGWTREDNAEGLKDWMNMLPIAKKGPLGLEMAFLIPNLVLLPLTLFTAEAVMRLCDSPSIVFSQWMYERSIGGKDDLCIHNGETAVLLALGSNERENLYEGVD